MPRRGHTGAGLADAELYALRDEDARPVDPLHQAAEDGWTYSWWWLLDHSPNMERLRALPELAKIRADFAARARLSAALPYWDHRGRCACELIRNVCFWLKADSFQTDQTRYMRTDINVCF